MADEKVWISPVPATFTSEAVMELEKELTQLREENSKMADHIKQLSFEVSLERNEYNRVEQENTKLKAEISDAREIIETYSSVLKYENGSVDQNAESWLKRNQERNEVK